MWGKVKELVRTWNRRPLKEDLRSIVNILQGKELEAYEE